MGPIRNPRWEQKRTEGYVIVSNFPHVNKMPTLTYNNNNSNNLLFSKSGPQGGIYI